MSTLPATMQNAYLARGGSFPCPPGENPAYCLAAIYELAGHIVDPIKVADLAAWYDEPIDTPLHEWRKAEPAGDIIKVYTIRYGGEVFQVPAEAMRQTE